MDNNKLSYGLILSMVIAVTYGHAQISPGKLSNAHAHLEGMANCTQCHDLGNKVPDYKCLDCHTEIDQLLKNNRGLHSNRSVRAQACIDCHSEHHGRKFDMVRFDQEDFDHDRTGYALEGEHARIDCRDCHKSEYIDDPDIRKRENTFLGLDQECLSCHDDFHQGTLSTDCKKCHDFESFRPASLFDHDETDYPLQGAHVEVDCAKCHPMERRKGVDFQVFSGIDFNDCVSCHDDPHRGQLPGNCASCHTMDAFTVFRGERRFNHNVTGFELRGKHAGINCFTCHEDRKGPANVFQDLRNIDEQNCVACHEDVHEGKFGSDCVKCHTETSFFDLKDMSLFNHDLTDFPLEGRHVDVDCAKCHSERYTDPVAFDNCYSCHEDYHRGEFTENGIQRDCDECHTVMKDFSYTEFGLAEHEATGFPLEGAHFATPCISCHRENEQWTFRIPENECVDCHENIHKEQISAEYYPDENCTACHNTEMWASVNFDHSLTEWPLEGAHKTTNCASCHFERTDEGLIQNFSDIANECNSCHKNVHGPQFEVNEQTDCARCHYSVDWTPVYFDHDSTDFPLEGQHAEIDCSACHDTGCYIDDEFIILYQIEQHECIDCHS